MPKRKRKKNPAAVNTGLLFAAVVTVWAVGRHFVYQAKKKRQRARGVARLPSMCPTGSVYDGEDCVEPTAPYNPPPPAPEIPTPTPTPTAPETPTPPAGDAPDALPPNLLPGSPAEPVCIQPIYSRTPRRIPLDIFTGFNQYGRDFTRSKLYFLTDDSMRRLVTKIADRYHSWPTLRSVVVRDALNELAPDCRWYVDGFDMSNAQQAIYSSAMDLARAVEANMGWSPPDSWSDLPPGYDDEILARTILGIPAPGTYQLKPGQRIEMVAIDPSLSFAEHVFARVIAFDAQMECYEYEVIDRFQGRTVRPRFGHHHGVNLGTRGCLNPTGGGAYRVYPLGTT